MPSPCLVLCCPTPPLVSLASHVASKLEEGNFKGAVRLACSEDTMADISPTFTALQDKHPPPTHLPYGPISVPVEAVVYVIKTFPGLKVLME